MSAPSRLPLRDPLLGGGLLLFLLMSLHFADDLARGEGARLGVGAEGFFAGAAAFLLLILLALGLRAVRPRSGTALLLVAGLAAALFLVGGHLVGLADPLDVVVEEGGLLAAWTLLVGTVVGAGTAVLAGWELWALGYRGERV